MNKLGWWSLKPKEELDPYRCFEIDEDDVLDFVNINVKKDYKITESDKEFLVKMIKDGYVEGQLNDWDER